MIVGMMAFGIASGLLAGMMTLGAGGSWLLALLAYATFGSLGAVLWATASLRRDATLSQTSDPRES